MHALPQNVPNQPLPIGPAANVAACTLLLKCTLVILKPAAILGHLASKLKPSHVFQAFVFICFVGIAALQVP